MSSVVINWETLAFYIEHVFLLNPDNVYYISCASLGDNYFHINIYEDRERTRLIGTINNFKLLD